MTIIKSIMQLKKIFMRLNGLYNIWLCTPSFLKSQNLVIVINIHHTFFVIIIFFFYLRSRGSINILGSHLYHHHPFLHHQRFWLSLHLVQPDHLYYFGLKLKMIGSNDFSSCFLLVDYSSISSCMKDKSA